MSTSLSSTVAFYSRAHLVLVRLSPCLFTPGSFFGICFAVSRSLPLHADRVPFTARVVSPTALLVCSLVLPRLTCCYRCPPISLESFSTLRLAFVVLLCLGVSAHSSSTCRRSLPFPSYSCTSLSLFSPVFPRPAPFSLPLFALQLPAFCSASVCLSPPLGFFPLVRSSLRSILPFPHSSPSPTSCPLPPSLVTALVVSVGLCFLIPPERSPLSSSSFPTVAFSVPSPPSPATSSSCLFFVGSCLTSRPFPLLAFVSPHPTHLALLSLFRPPWSYFFLLCAIIFFAFVLLVLRFALPIRLPPFSSRVPASRIDPAFAVLYF